jgi:hypothetical protein
VAGPSPFGSGRVDCSGRGRCVACGKASEGGGWAVWTGCPGWSGCCGWAVRAGCAGCSGCRGCAWGAFDSARAPTGALDGSACVASALDRGSPPLVGAPVSRADSRVPAPFLSPFPARLPDTCAAWSRDGAVAREPAPPAAHPPCVGSPEVAGPVVAGACAPPADDPPPWSRCA